MASDHWPAVAADCFSVSMSVYFRAFYTTFKKVQSIKSVKCNASPKHYTKSLRWRWRGAGWYCSPALLHYVHPVIEPNFYIRFIAEYHSIPVTIYRQVPLSSTPSYPTRQLYLCHPHAAQLLAIAHFRRLPHKHGTLYHNKFRTHLLFLSSDGN